MAKDNSFDLVSETDMQEVNNAFMQAEKELKQRFDLKDSSASLEFDKGDSTLTLTAPSEFVAGQVKDILHTKLNKRGVDLKSVKWSEFEKASGDGVRTKGKIEQGIDEVTIKKINKDIKDKKFKAKTQIQGEQIRITSPSRDELQNIISFLKEKDYGLPLQFINYR